MDSIISLHNICNAAITTIDDARMIVRQADDAKASHVIQETALVEEVQRLLQESRKTESDAEHTRTPTPLSEIDANPGPEPPQRRQHTTNQATRNQKKEWRMGGVFDSRGRKLVYQQSNFPSSPIAGPRKLKRGRDGLDSDDEARQAPKRVKRREAFPREKFENARVMGEDILGPRTRSRTFRSLKRFIR